MGKTVSKRQPAIVAVVDHDTDVLDLRVFSAPSRNVEPEVVGTATLRMQDLRDVVAILSERLQFQDLMDAGQAAARKGKKAKRAIA
jgi:hypothetical protein